MNAKGRNIIITRILTLISGMVIIIVFLLVIIFALFSSMDGLANAIDKSGSERMRTILLGYYASSFIDAAAKNEKERQGVLKENIEREMETYEKFLTGLKNGSDELGLIATKDDQILALINEWEKEWETYRTSIETIIQPGASLSRMESQRPLIEVTKAVELKNTAHKVVIAYTTQSNATLNRIKLVLFILIGVVIVVALVISFFISKTLKPIKELLAVLHRLAKKDLTVRSYLKTKDEIGQIGKAVDEMSLSFDTFIGEIRNTSDAVDRSNEDLSASVEESGAAVREMVASIESVNTSLEQQKKAVDVSAESVDTMIHLTGEITENIAIQADTIRESSANIEEMVSSIKSVGNSVESAKKLTEELSEAAHSGGKKIKATIEAIGTINSASMRIQEAVTGIAGIAATTNLLSMNASIEAAHAGDAGRGFAVVAKEIGKLATDSAGEAKKIKNIVDEAVNMIKHGMNLSSEAGDAFDTILEDINRNVTIVAMIAQAMHEQNSGAQDILVSIERMVQLSERILEISKEEDEKSRLTLESIRQMEMLSLEILNASNEQKVGGIELLHALKLLQDVTERNQNTVRDLNTKIEQFKVSSNEDGS